MHGYYEKLLRKYKDVVSVREVVALTGYAKPTVNNWRNRGNAEIVPKRAAFLYTEGFSH